MYVTAILILLLVVCMFVAYTNAGDFKLKPFDKDTNLPLRGLMALLIILSHIGQKTDITIIENFDSNKYDIGAQIVSMFFFLSGYGMFLSYVAKRKLYIKGFLKKRLGTILPKFLLLTVGTVLVLHYFVNLDIGEQFANFIHKGITPLPHSWFIFAIIYIYLSFYICSLTNMEPKKVACMFLLFTCIYIVVMIKILHFYHYWWISILSVNLGSFVALYRDDISRLLIRHRYAAYSALIALLIISYSILDFKLYTIEYTRLAMILIWYLIQSMACYVIVRTLGFVQWEWLSYCGMISLDLYLVHGIPLKIADSAGLDDWNLLLVTYMLVFPAAIILNRAFDKKFMCCLYNKMKPHSSKKAVDKN